MTRKDYVAIAEALAAVRQMSGSDEFRSAVDQVSGAIAHVLQNDNPRFDMDRFFKAVSA